MSRSGDTVAVVLAAGQGTRMKSDLPKVLHPVLGDAMVTRVLRRAQEAGCKRAVVVVGYGRDEVEARIHADQTTLGQITVRFAVQEKQLGTADAVHSALPELQPSDRNVLILYGDVPNIRQQTLDLLQANRIEDGVVFASMRVPDPTGYGRVERDDEGRVLRIVEHDDCRTEQLAIDEVNAGIYLVPSDFLKEHLGNISSANAQDEFYLTDLVEIARERGGVEALIVPDGEELQGVNDRLQLARADDRARRLVLERWMKSGVTMLNPATIRIEESVTLGRDVVLEPAVALLGTTTVGDTATVGQGAILRDCDVLPGAHVPPYSVLSNDRVG